jgi:hypothetical protein
MPALSTVEGVVEGKGLPRFWDAVGPFFVFPSGPIALRGRSWSGWRKMPPTPSWLDAGI